MIICLAICCARVKCTWRPIKEIEEMLPGASATG